MADEAAGREGAERCVVAGAAAGAAAAERDAAGVADERKVVELGGVGTSGEPLAAPVGPPGGNVGSLMVGAAVGLGGKLMRTVSFLGCTLPVSFFGGTAPVGTGEEAGLNGGMSAIMFAGQDKPTGEAVKFISQPKSGGTGGRRPAGSGFFLDQFAAGATE